MKRVIVCGAGEVGRYAAEVLVQEGHHVSVIDVDSAKLKQLEEAIDIHSIKGSSCHPETLRDAKIDSCDLLMAATNHDEFNLLTAALGKKMGAVRVVARIHQRSYVESKAFDYRTEFNVDHIICPEQLTSQAIVSILEDPGVMAIESFAQNKIEMHRYTVRGDSSAVGAKLSDLGLPAAVRVAMVDRSGDYFTPSGDTVLQSNDVVTLIGEHTCYKSINHLFSDSKRKTNNVAIVGGTSMCEWLVNDLHREHYTVRVFESSRGRAIELSEKFPHVTVLDTEPTDPKEFQEEHLEECVAFISVSEDDEHNILASLQAKRLGAPRTIAVVHASTYLPLLENLGVDWPFSPRIVAAKELLKLVNDSKVRTLATLAPGVAEVYEVGPVVKGAAVDRMLKDIQLPKGAFVAAIQRGGEVHVPGATHQISRGDILVVIGPTQAEKTFHKLFISS